MEPRHVVAGNMFGREDAIRSWHCVDPPMGCGRKISQVEFETWPMLTLREYKQSGWCDRCQDRVFRDPDEEEGCTCNDGPCCEVDVGVGIITCGDQHRRVCPVHEMLGPMSGKFGDYDPDMREEDPPEDLYAIPPRQTWPTYYL
jgi:hypothetical protein